MFTPQNEDYLLSIRASHYREPSKYKFEQQCKMYGSYIILKFRCKILQNAFNKWSNQNSPCFNIRIGQIQSYKAGYESSCTGFITSMNHDYLCFSNNFINNFFKYFGKTNDYTIFFEKNSVAYLIYPIFHDKIHSITNTRINGIVDEDRHHILFVFRGHRHRITTRANFLNSGDFVTFLLRPKYNSLIPIRIKITFSANRNTLGYGAM